MVDLKTISSEEIHQLIAEGKLPDTIRYHRFKQITACQQSIEDCLTKLENMGFNPAEVYYALRTHMYWMKFAWEDGDREDEMNKIDDEILKDMMAHRKEYPKERMRKIKRGNLSV